MNRVPEKSTVADLMVGLLFCAAPDEVASGGWWRQVAAGDRRELKVMK